MGYTCSVCGEYHDELMLDIRLGLPDDVFALSEDERERATEHGEDWCILRTGAPRYFVRALLEIPVPELETYFGYGLWAELDEAGFERIRALWDDPSGADEPPFAARLANELAPYRADDRAARPDPVAGRRPAADDRAHRRAARARRRSAQRDHRRAGPGAGGDGRSLASSWAAAGYDPNVRSSRVRPRISASALLISASSGCPPSTASKR